MQYPIYLDYNATTPVHPKVLEVMLPFFSADFGNAASIAHIYGLKASDAIETARSQMAQLIGANNNEIVFTSGATESVNLAIKGVFEANKHKGNHIITAKTEHKAVIDTCHHLEQLGAEITFLDVDSIGNISFESIQKAIKPTTILISIMAANNEIGNIYPIENIAKLAHEKGILFHTDATQAIGKTKIDLIDSNIDLLSLSAHKFYGPKGVGALFIRKNVRLIAQQDGGMHERGLRSGTLNVPGIVGMGKAAEIAQYELEADANRISIMRDKLENQLLKSIPNAKVNGDPKNRLFNTTNISFGKIDGELLLMKLNEIAVSNGSACNSASTKPSYVLKAMGLDDDSAFGSIRFSLGKFTTEKELDQAIRHLIEVITKFTSV